MRKYSYSVLFFIPFALFLVLFFTQKSIAADGNQFRDPNMWQRERTINDAINKSSVKVEAQKTYPVSTLNQNGKPIKQIRTAKSTIILGAKSGNIAKTLMKRAPSTAIGYAVVAILGRTVDWILDPANNRVKYKELGGDFKDGFAYRAGPDTSGKLYPTPQAACNGGMSFLPKDAEWLFVHVQMEEDGNGVCRGTSNGGSLTNLFTFIKVPYEPPPTTEQDWRYISGDELAQKVIQQAGNGDGPAMEVMNDAAIDALEAGLLDAQLDAASNVPQPDTKEITQAQYDNPNYPENGTGSGTGPETPVDPETPTDPTDPTPNPDAKPFELPPFCSWASKVCDFIDWVKTEPPEPPESGEVDVQIPDSNMHEGILERLYIDMPAQCPPDPVLEFMGARIPFPMSVFCQFAAMMKPLILLFAYIKGLSIIGSGLS